MEKHILNVSGGKDSVAMWILATLEWGYEVIPVFADTDHEHPETYRYIEYIEKVLGPITVVKADLTKQMERRRMAIARDQRIGRDKKGRKLRYSNKAKRRSLEAMYPTGNVFLDSCLIHGRFPSPMARFCSQQLKHEPIREQIVEPLLMDGHIVVSWQGVRKEESFKRSKLTFTDSPEDGLVVFRPILNYTSKDVFDLFRKHGIKWNPLYEQGMGRVGCMPCIHTGKKELREIAARWPEVIEYIDYMEQKVSMATKHGQATFFLTDRLKSSNPSTRITRETHGIHAAVEWSKTTWGGVEYDSENQPQLEMCSSIYGLCESAN